MTTAELDDIAYECITGAGALPSFKGYRGYPSTICVSINDEIVHGIPGQRIVNEGDLVGMDVGAIVDGYQGDSAVTLGVGEISDAARALLKRVRLSGSCDSNSSGRAPHRRHFLGCPGVR